MLPVTADVSFAIAYGQCSVVLSASKSKAFLAEPRDRRMRADLRPSSLGEILDRTAQMYRSHFLLYFGIAAVSYAAVLLLSLVLDVLLHPYALANPRSYASLRVAAGVIVGVFTILPVSIAMAAVIQAVARNYLGQTCTIHEAYAMVRRRWYRYILIFLAMYVYTFLPVALLMGVLIGGAALVPAGAARIAVIMLAFLLVFAGIVLASWRLLRWALSIPASVMEDLTVHRALKRSSKLTQGSAGRIFVMLLLVGAIMTIIQYAFLVPTIILLVKSKGAITLTTQVISSLGSSFSGAFVLPIYSIALTLFYYDQRIRKEGYDVEWLLEQAMMTPGVTPATLPGALTPQTEPHSPAI